MWNHFSNLIKISLIKTEKSHNSQFLTLPISCVQSQVFGYPVLVCGVLTLNSSQYLTN